MSSLTFHYPVARRSSPSGSPGGQCNTGPVQCCNSVTTADHSSTSTLLGLLGLVLDPSILVGLKCSPLSAIGLGGNSWWASSHCLHRFSIHWMSCSSQQPVCCENNTYNGLIVIGCSPSMLIMLPRCDFLLTVLLSQLISVVTRRFRVLASWSSSENLFRGSLFLPLLHS